MSETEAYEPPETIPLKNLEYFGIGDRSSIHWWSPDGIIQHLFIEGHIRREADRREIIHRVSNRCPFSELFVGLDPGTSLVDPDQIVLYVKMSGFEQHPGPEALEAMKWALYEDLDWG